MLLGLEEYTSINYINELVWGGINTNTNKKVVKVPPTFGWVGGHSQERINKKMLWIEIIPSKTISTR